MCLLERASGPGTLAGHNLINIVQDMALAQTCAEEALAAAMALGEDTYGRRQARAYVWRGFVALRAPFMDAKAATGFKERARQLLPRPEEAGYIGQELRQLEAELRLFTRRKTKIPYTFSISVSDLKGRSRTSLHNALDDFLVCASNWNHSTSRKIKKRLRFPGELYAKVAKRCKRRGWLNLEERNGGARRRKK
jgi:hypothetical protein